MRSTYPNVLLLDAGDFFWDRKEYADLRVEANIDALDMMDYDAMNIAEGEVRYGIDQLARLSPELQQRLVSANLISRHKGESLWQPFLSFTFDGLRAAVIGTVGPNMITQTDMEKASIKIEDDMTVLKHWVPRLKQNHKLVLLLSHAGWKHSVKLAEAIKDFDVIIVGHDYYPDFQPETIGDTTLFKCSIGGKHLGVIKMWFDKNDKLSKSEGELIPLSEDVVVDPVFMGPEEIYERKKRALQSSD